MLLVLAGTAQAALGDNPNGLTAITSSVELSKLRLVERLEPDGFFDRNPALDVPAPVSCHAPGPLPGWVRGRAHVRARDLRGGMRAVSRAGA
jgi:hypothetical protein